MLTCPKGCLDIRVAIAAVLAALFVLSTDPCLADDVDPKPDPVGQPAPSLPDATDDTGSADTDSGSLASASDAEDDKDIWSFRLVVPLYIWWPNMEGTAEIDGFKIDYELDHGDVIKLIVDDFNGIWTFFGEVKRKRLAARMDLFYIKLHDVSLDDLNLSAGPLPRLDLDQDYNMLLLHPNFSYDLYETSLNFGPVKSFQLGAVAGFRYLYFDGEAQISDSLDPDLIGLRVLNVSEHYWTLLPVGAQINIDFLENWSFRSRVMLGGWRMLDAKGGGTDGQGDAILAYRFHKNWVFEFGVRWIDLSFKGKTLDYELENAWGPVFGLMANF